MAKFTSIIERALRDTRKKSIAESAGLPAEEEKEDMSLEDIFQSGNSAEDTVDDSSDFFSLDADSSLSDITFDEEQAREDKGDKWYTELKEPIQKYLEKSNQPVFLDGDEEIDKASFETALTELFSSLGISQFSGEILEDGTITVKQTEAGEEKNAEDLKKVDGVDEEILGSEGALEEDFEGDDADPSLMPMNDENGSKGGKAEILSLGVEWDGTSAAIGDMDVEYEDEDSKEDESEDEPEDEEAEGDEEESTEDSENLDESEEVDASTLLRSLSGPDEEEDIFESDLSNGGAKSDRAPAGEGSGKAKFNNGADESDFLDNNDMTPTEYSTGTSEPKKTGDYFMGDGELQGIEAPVISDLNVDTSKDPKITKFIPNTDDFNDDLATVGIKEEFDFEVGGKQVDVGDDMVQSELSVDDEGEPDEFVWGSAFDTSDEAEDMDRRESGDGTALTGKVDPIKNFQNPEDELDEGPLVARGEGQ